LHGDKVKEKAAEGNDNIDPTVTSVGTLLPRVWSLPDGAINKKGALAGAFV